MSPRAPSTETTTSGTERSLGSRLHQPWATPKSAFPREGLLCRPGPVLQNAASSPSQSGPRDGLSRAALSPYSPGDPGRAGCQGTWDGGAKGSGEARGREGAWSGAPPTGRTSQVGGGPGAGPHDPAVLGAGQGLGGAAGPGAGRGRPVERRGRGTRKSEMSGSAPPWGPAQNNGSALHTRIKA